MDVPPVLCTCRKINTNEIFAVTVVKQYNNTSIHAHTYMIHTFFCKARSRWDSISNFQWKHTGAFTMGLDFQLSMETHSRNTRDTVTQYTKTHAQQTYKQHKHNTQEGKGKPAPLLVPTESLGGVKGTGAGTRKTRGAVCAARAKR